MNYKLFALIAIFLPLESYANGVGKMIDQYPMSKEEKEELKNKKRISHEKLLKKEAVIKQQMEENPRNKAFTESFGEVSSQGKIKKKVRNQKASQ